MRRRFKRRRSNAHNVLSQAAWLQKQIVEGSGDVMAGGDETFEVERRALVTA